MCSEHKPWLNKIMSYLKLCSDQAAKSDTIRFKSRLAWSEHAKSDPSRFSQTSVHRWFT